MSIQPHLPSSAQQRTQRSCPAPDLGDKDRTTPWLQTFTGRAFHPTDPRAQDVDVLDIAHSLAMQCRYNGHCTRFYSVAEHCVLISQHVSPANALWGLLHDATEAYVGDMVRPLKLQIPQYRQIEAAVEVVITQAFGLLLPIPDEVEFIDKAIIADERAAVMGEPDLPWSPKEPLGITIHGWGPQEAEQQFLLRYAELTGDPAGLVVGKCGSNREHLGHVVRQSSVGRYWCEGMEVDPDAGAPAPGRFPKLRDRVRPGQPVRRWARP